MFPPELNPRSGQTPARRIGRRGRPLSFVLAVALLAVFWGGLVGTAVSGFTRDHGHSQAHDQTGAAYGLVFWTLLVAILIWRVWRGGRTAIAFASRIGMAVGWVIVISVVVLGGLMVAMPPGGSVLTLVLRLLLGVCSGAALLTAAFLLRRREVGEWSSGPGS